MTWPERVHRVAAIVVVSALLVHMAVVVFMFYMGYGDEQVSPWIFVSLGIPLVIFLVSAVLSMLSEHRHD